MSFDRAVPPVSVGAEGVPKTLPSMEAGPSPSIRLQILSTEHWGLLSSRSLAWNEAFSRTGIFLSTLSGTIVALALVAQASQFGDAFTMFALLILPVVLFVGVVTMVRVGESNYHEALCLIGMNRIRNAYLQLAPDLERYFVMSAHDDLSGVSKSAGFPPGGKGISFAQVLSATAVLVAVLNSVLAGVIAALVTIRVGSTGAVALMIGVATFVVVFALQIWYSMRGADRMIASYRPLFPTPESS